MSIESSVVFEEKVGLTARDFGNPKIDIQKMILAKIAQKLEGKCSVHGWVKPRTLKILSRSMGYVEKGRFTGDIVFHVQAEGKVYNPPSGVEVVGTVSGNNKMGMYVTVEDAIKVILPRDLHIGQEYEDFHNTQIGDKVRVEIKKSRFQVNDEFILSVGLFLGKVGSGYKGPQRAVIEEDIESESRLANEAAQRMAKFQEEQEEAQRRLDQEERNKALAEKLQEEEYKAPETEPDIALAPAPTVAPKTTKNKNKSKAKTTTTTTVQPIINNDAMPPLVPINNTETKEEQQERNELQRPLPAAANIMPPYSTDEVFEFTKTSSHDLNWPALLEVDGKLYGSLGQFLKANMYEDPAVRERIQSKLSTGQKPSNADLASPIRPDWDNIKEKLLYTAIQAKYQENPIAKKDLEKTFPKKLVYNSTDAYWGTGRSGKGKNRLGYLLMKYRESLPGLGNPMEAID